MKATTAHMEAVQTAAMHVIEFEGPQWTIDRLASHAKMAKAPEVSLWPIFHELSGMLVYLIHAGPAVSAMPHANKTLNRCLKTDHRMLTIRFQSTVMAL